MKLRNKILTGYGVAFVLMSLVVMWAVTNLVGLGKATDAILQENYRSILAAENMIDALERQDSAILLVYLGEKEKGRNQFRDRVTEFYEWLARAKDNVTIAGEAELVSSIENNYQKYRRYFSTLSDRVEFDAHPLQSVLKEYEETVHPMFITVRDVCVELRHLNEETMYAASVRAGRVATRAIWSTIVVAAVAMVAALIFSWFLAERIVRPIRRFMTASRCISQGDYDTRIPVETKDELGHLAGEFNQMVEQLGRYHEMNVEQIIAEKNKGIAILSSIKDGLVVFDTKLHVDGINPAARRMLDLEFTDSSTLQCQDILPGSKVCELIATTVETGTLPELPDDGRIISFYESDKTRHYSFSITVARGRDRSLSGIVLLLRDVTRIKELEQMKSEFVMAASHELRTPLTSLGMSVDLLMENLTRTLSESDLALLQAAHEEVHRMKVLVNDLLDLSKMELGKIKLEFESVSVSYLFNRVGEVFRSQMEMKGVNFSISDAKDAPRIRADVTKITWVLTNLISNALRYVVKGGHISVAARRYGARVHIWVRDDGPGIPVKYQSKIFDKFVQIKGRESTGSGLGLAICKEIVRAHGGTIWVESTPGQGSTFTFAVPAVEKEESWQRH